jgi:hypothetical protein
MSETLCIYVGGGVLQFLPPYLAHNRCSSIYHVTTLFWFSSTAHFTTCQIVLPKGHHVFLMEMIWCLRAAAGYGTGWVATGKALFAGRAATMRAGTVPLQTHSVHLVTGWSLIGVTFYTVYHNKYTEVSPSSHHHYRRRRHHHHHHLLSQVSFPLVPLLNQWCIPPLRLQASDCSTFLIICHVPSTAVFFCRESTDCFLGTVYRYVSSSFTIPVAPMIIGMKKHFIFHIC